MKILVINAGSSSLKYQLFSMENREVLAKGLFERIGIDGKVFHKPSGGKPEYRADSPLPDHRAAVKILLELLVGAEYGVIGSVGEIAAVGHRVLHGGEKFSGSVVVTDAVIGAVRECVPLGPLHNPANLVGIQSCQAVMDVPQIAVFDTAFHRSMPPEAYMYAVPYEWYAENHVRRYGFHGTSHRFVSGRAAELLAAAGLPNGRIVTCHLGNGSSLAAVKDGKCADTTMGLTPLEGVPMGTRSGSIDPAIVAFIAGERGMSAAEVTDALNKKSGVLGISGVSSDFRDLAAAERAGNERAKLALDHFAFNVRKSIAQMAAAMGGIDALAFTAGIGENDRAMRARIVKGLEFIGLNLDADKNAAVSGEGDVSPDASPARILVIPTNEELAIALDTEELIKQK